MYDNRHNVLNVRKGLFTELSFLEYNSGFLSDFDFRSVNLDLRSFHPMGNQQVLAWQVKRGWNQQPWTLPVVAETWDGHLNDASGFHVKPEHAFEALDSARGGPVVEGSVGGGTGMICNEFKGGQTHAHDPQTGERVALFNPRLQIWAEHFAWSEEGAEVLGKTPSGRATVVALQMNNTEIVVARRLWVTAGWWPPQD